ncbi:MAG: hypothetical protein BWY07_01056 [Candidatus Hydrogenedentes bacterium ADurb.Bin170]|jgi:hypothetical protein|nr:MAG: hypothetical protein BWY07_01056 [Candidatus Hydrogenedentes bacterium ADurb.Bin170]
MSQGIFPLRVRVAVFVMARLDANAEIGVPRGRIAFLHVIPAKAGILLRIKIPACAGMTPGGGRNGGGET